MAGSFLDFMLIGNRWVSVARPWSTPRYEGKAWVFHGQRDQLTELLKSGVIMEHPEWLAVLPPAFDIENWVVDPGPRDFEHLWDISRDLQTLTTKKAVRLGMLTLIVNTGQYDWPMLGMNGRQL